MTKPRKNPTVRPYKGPAGGYGSLKSVAEILIREGLPVEGVRVTSHQNKPGGFMCVSCAWAKPAQPHHAKPAHAPHEPRAAHAGAPTAANGEPRKRRRRRGRGGGGGAGTAKPASDV